MYGFLSSNDEGGLAYNDPDIGVEWPIPEGMSLIMSEKDQKWGSFQEFSKNRGKKMRKEASLPVELYRNRRLVFSLAKNDFKTKYAGSYFGTVWAFIQPIVTICVYWFVFGLALRNGADRGVPFVLWLVAGLVPWFFIQDGLTGGTASLLEYNYLVKKVVFNIRILPVVKVFSAVLCTAFFIVIILVIYTCMGYPPDLYALQLIYYSFCTFMLILGSPILQVLWLFSSGISCR